MFEGAHNIDDSVIERAASRMAAILGGLSMLLFIAFVSGLAWIALTVIGRVWL